MKNKLPTLISTISNSFSDFTLDIAISKYNTYLILLCINIGSFFIQLLYGLHSGFIFTSSSLLYIILRSILLLIGYILYIYALKRIPISLIALLESGTLFIYLIVDWFNGLLEVDIWFVFLFIMFLYSIFLFSYDTYKYKDSIKSKKIDLHGIILLLLSTLFYSIEPYLIKLAFINGANETAINVCYYFLTIPFFLIMFIKNKKQAKIKSLINSETLELITYISIFEAIYYIFGTKSYFNNSIIIVTIIQEIQLFLIYLLSVFIGTDKITLKKLMGIIIGTLSVIGIYLY